MTSGVLSLVTAGVSTSFAVTCRDSLGALLATDPGMAVAVESAAGVRQVPGSVTFQGSGGYTAAYTPGVVGTYAVTLGVMRGACRGGMWRRTRG